MTMSPAIGAGLAAAVVVLWAGSAGAAATPTGQCIDNSNATGWTAQDDHRIVVRSNGRMFLVTTNACPRLGAPLTHVTVEPQAGALICSPHDARLYVSSADGIRTPCVMQSIAPLSADELRELRAARR